MKRNFLKRTLCLALTLLLAAMILPISASAASVTDFADVKSTAWYYNAVRRFPPAPDIC